METKPMDTNVTNEPAHNVSSEPSMPVQTTPSITQTQNSTEPRNFFVTFLLAILGGHLGLRHFYLGNKMLGWIRAGLFIGGYVVIFLGGVTGELGLIIFGYGALIAAAIWATVDFFHVYFNVKSDNDGQPLVTTKRDLKWAKTIFWFIVGLAVLTIISSASIFSWAGNEIMNNRFQNGFNDSRYENPSPSSLDSEYRFNSTDL